MSFILDALKKAESERTRSAGPVLMDVRIAQSRQRRRAYHRRLRSIGGQGPQRADAGAVALLRRMERLRELLVAGRVAPQAIAQRRRRPLRCPIGVTAGAGVRDTERHRAIGPRHPEAVIAPRIDGHVPRLRHMARHAACSFGTGVVKVM